MMLEKIPRGFMFLQNSNSIWCSKRLFVAIVIFLCFTNCAMLMYNVNIVVVEMTSSRKIIVGNATVFLPAEFQWDTVTIGIVSSIHSYGAFFAFIGGYFVDKLGGSVTCAMSMMVCGALTVLHPLILYLDFNTFLISRFVTGIFVNSFFVSTAEIYSRWFPKKERSTLIAIGYNGLNVGAATVYSLFGYVADEWGWRSVFYASGIISLLISLLCLVTVKNRPSQDKWISEAELSYILDGTDHASRKEVVFHPYKEIFSSTPVFALCSGKFTLMWVTTMLNMSLPSYVKDLTGKSTDEVGIISSVPTACQIFIFPVASVFLDNLKKISGIEWTLIHKITIGFAFLTSSVCFMAAVAFNDFKMSMILFVLVQIMMSVAPAVIEPTTVNISPRDSNVIAALGQFFCSISIVISRTCFGFMTVDHSSQEWNNCFLLTSGVLILGLVIFSVFGSSEAQPWSLSLIFEPERERLIE